MTDAREIIATKLPCADAIKQQWAQEIIDTLTATGFRILGPDEVDPVTVEKCAIELEVNWGHICTPEMRAAIRAIGRKA